MGAFDHSRYVSITMEFRCNLRCAHCMIEGTMDRLRPESAARFDALLAENARTRRWTGLVLTGAEITLNAELPRMAEKARRHGFEHVRIQTHGMHLSRADYVRRLVDAGVDEYFVSVTAPDAATHDAITGVPGSFERMAAGLDLLEREEVRVITNTVVTSRSHPLLADIVRRFARLRRLVQMEFWVYWPMRETDERDLIPRHTDVLPHLVEAIDLARGAGRAVEVKNFPQCLLGERADVLANDQPQLFVDEAFWAEFARNGFHQCVHRDVCGAAQCLGLNTAYVLKHGYEETLLRPVP